MKEDTIQDLRAFDETVFDVIQEYLDDIDVYPENIVLAVNPKTMEVFIETPDNCNDCETFNLSTLIRKDEDGNNEPDGDATYDLASQFYFVR